MLPMKAGFGDLTPKVLLMGRCFGTCRTGAAPAPLRCHFAQQEPLELQLARQELAAREHGSHYKPTNQGKPAALDAAEPCAG